MTTEEFIEELKKYDVKFICNNKDVKKVNSGSEQKRGYVRFVLWLKPNTLKYGSR